MVRLPAVDLGIMAEHITAHIGAINKLELYQDKVTINKLKEIIQLQANTMRVHVNTMLALINPYHHGDIELPSLDTINAVRSHISNHMAYRGETDNKWITLEAHTTAEFMSNDNYSSALMMKDQNVRHIHVEMGLQQFQIMEMYTTFMEQMG
ncbi:hypothetical protein WMZ97_18850 [Lentibacillus sp. N15]|uniref:hypothetical protein n=1 Tax=Lentibacillus songyuanensis TaxID=3136161 RepID=UPI0031BB20D7